MIIDQDIFWTYPYFERANEALSLKEIKPGCTRIQLLLEFPKMHKICTRILLSVSRGRLEKKEFVERKDPKRLVWAVQTRRGVEYTFHTCRIKSSKLLLLFLHNQKNQLSLVLLWFQTTRLDMDLYSSYLAERGYFILVHYGWMIKRARSDVSTFKH